MPTLSPLITWIMMSEPLVIQGNRVVMKSTRSSVAATGPGAAGAPRPQASRLLLLGHGGAALGDLRAAPDELLAVVLLDVGEHRLALGAHLHLSDPLGRDRLMVAAAHDDLAPGALHVEALVEGRDDIVGVGALGAPDRLGDDIGAGV